MALITGTFFVMVFPWSPGVSDVLRHSIPFMFNRLGLVVFCLVQAVTMVRLDEQHGITGIQSKWVFIGFMVMWAGVVMYGLNFMMTSLLKEYDLGEGKQVHIAELPPGNVPGSLNWVG